MNNKTHELYKPANPEVYNRPQNHIRAFGHFLYSDLKDNECILLRIFHKDSTLPITVYANNIDEFVEICMKYLVNHTIFSGVSFHSKEMYKQGKTGKESCTGTSVLWADIDIGETGHKRKNHFQTLDEAIEHIIHLSQKPDLWIYTGGGYHLYWKLDKRADFPDNQKKVEECNRHIATLCHGDNVHDVSRIMRVPGTTNYKYGDGGLDTSIVFPKLNKDGGFDNGQA